MLDMYDFEDDIWLCHSFQGRCYNITAFVTFLPPRIGLAMLFNFFQKN